MPNFYGRFCVYFYTRSDLKASVKNACDYDKLDHKKEMIQKSKEKNAHLSNELLINLTFLKAYTN